MDDTSSIDVSTIFHFQKFEINPLSIPKNFLSNCTRPFHLESKGISIFQSIVDRQIFKNS